MGPVSMGSRSSVPFVGALAPAASAASATTPAHMNGTTITQQILACQGRTNVASKHVDQWLESFIMGDVECLEDGFVDDSSTSRP